MKNITFIIFFSILFINNSSSQWVELNTGYNENFRSISAVDDNICWLAGSGTGKIIRTTSGGSSWLEVLSGTSGYNVKDIFAFDNSKALIVMATLPSAQIYMTTNGGTNWFIVNPSVTQYLTSMEFSSPDSGLVVGVNNPQTRFVIWRTTTGGLLWDSTGLTFPTLNTNEYVNDRSLFVMGQKAWFVTNQKRVLYSTNFGTTWTAQQLFPINLSSDCNVWFNTSTLGMVGGTTIPSYTTNGGTTWTAQTQPPGPTGTQVVGMIGSGNNFWCGFGKSIYMTTNNGTNWTDVYTIGDYDFINMSLSRTGSTAWATREFGKVCKNASLIGIQPISTNIPVNYGLEQNYPNPFNPATTIRFSLPHPSEGREPVKLIVYDVLGNEVSVLVNENLRAGEYEVSWDAMLRSSGVYFYKLLAGDYTETKRMVLVK